MIWKIVMISIAIVFGSIIIGGAIIATQVLTSIPNFGDENIVDSGLLSSGSDPSLPVEGTVRIVGNTGSNSYSQILLKSKWEKQ
jgi:hypothetical protein